jgi:hypothetical protein
MVCTTFPNNSVEDGDTSLSMSPILSNDDDGQPSHCNRRLPEFEFEGELKEEEFLQLSILLPTIYVCDREDSSVAYATLIFVHSVKVDHATYIWCLLSYEKGASNLNEHKFNVTNDKCNLLYTTRAVPGPIALFPEPVVGEKIAKVIGTLGSNQFDVIVASTEQQASETTTTTSDSSSNIIRTSVYETS